LPGVDLTPRLGAGNVRFIWPVANAVLTQGFGPSHYSYEPPYGSYPHFHTGIDLAAPLNSPVVAAAAGVVLVVGRDPWGYGSYVVISHDGGLATLYGHLNVVKVVVGQQVNQAQQIGLEGSTGISTGPHVHFEVRSGGVPTDPLPYVPPLIT
jgi:murein DD-endopeptidase MepM/ murein hydrolase activator NlpD